MKYFWANLKAKVSKSKNRTEIFLCFIKQDIIQISFEIIIKCLKYSVFHTNIFYISVNIHIQTKIVSLKINQL